MATKFEENIILHIEDDPNWSDSVKDTIQRSEEIIAAYGGKISYVNSIVKEELILEDLEKEIGRIGREMKNGPTLVSVITAQVARTFLSSYLPGVIISDTSFPLNGKKVVEWICAHGYKDYALIGLSGNEFSSLDYSLKEWFGQSNARYFWKGDLSSDELREQIIRNRMDNSRRYKHK